VIPGGNDQLYEEAGKKNWLLLLCYFTVIAAKPPPGFTAD